MKNYVSQGNTLNFIAPKGGVTSGQAVLLGHVLLIPMDHAAEGQPAVGLRCGEFILPANLTADVNLGDKAYFDPTNKVFSEVETNNLLVGFFSEFATTGSSQALVMLTGALT